MKIKNVSLSKRLGLKTPAFISQLVNKKASVTTDFAERIAKAYPDLNVRWLLHGTGEMLITMSPDVQEQDVEYKSDPLGGLRLLLSEQEERIKHLEAEIKALKDEHKALLNEVRLLREESGDTKVRGGE